MQFVRIAAMLCAVTSALGSCTGVRDAELRAAERSPPTAAPMSSSTQGYLQAAMLPRSTLIAPRPPEKASAAMARDEEGNRRALVLRGSPRWELAAKDAVLTFPAVAQTFACALNVPVSREITPKVLSLLQRTLLDAGRATNDAKDRYKRTRPFVDNGEPICTPNQQSALRNNGSYPSGHASIGFAFGMVLSEVAPERTEELIRRGLAFGESRIVCNVHWPSDVHQGQIVAAAVVARLNADEQFRADVAAARAEVSALRAQSAAPDAAQCAAEAAALSMQN